MLRETPSLLYHWCLCHFTINCVTINYLETHIDDTACLCTRCRGSSETVLIFNVNRMEKKDRKDWCKKEISIFKIMNLVMNKIF